MSKIINLRAENIQKIKVVDITPADNMVVVGGRNEAGKTSTLDSIQYAIGGKKQFSEMPVRQGETEGRIVLETDELVVIRTINGLTGNDTLEVKNKQGVPQSSPQTLLNKLVSKLTFDPAAFANMEGREQVVVLKGLVPYDFVGHEKQYKLLYDERTYVNRQVDELEALNKNNPYNPAIGAVEASTDSITQALNQVAAFATAKAEATSKVNEAKAKLEQVKQEIAALTDKQGKIEAWLVANEPKLAQFPDRDTTQLQAQLASIEAENAVIRKNQQAKIGLDKLNEQKEKQRKLNIDLDGLNEKKLAAIKSAKLPVEGLTFSEEGVFFDGIPFAQLSGAQRLKVSAAMGISLNPNLKVLLIRDGSLLDNDNMAVLAQMAKDYDVQIWVERVGEGQEVSVVIEDGLVKEDRTIAAKT